MTARTIILLAWLSCAASVYLALWAGARSILAFVHPNWAFGHYLPYVAAVSLASIPVAFALAVRLTLIRRRHPVRRLQRELDCYYLGLVTVALAGWLLIPPVPEFRTQHLGDQPYRIPSAYTRLDRDMPPGEASGLRIDFCPENLAGIYQSDAHGCRSVAATLRPPGANIAASVGASRLLDEVLAVPRRGDRLLSIESLPGPPIEGEGWVGFVGPRTGTHAYHLMLDDAGAILRFGACRTTQPGRGRCRFWARRSFGLLEYEIDYGGRFEPHVWKATEDRIFELMETWRVT